MTRYDQKNNNNDEETYNTASTHHDVDLDSMISQMNISQKKMYQRLIEILPRMDQQKEIIIKDLLRFHILGVSEELRIQRVLFHLDIFNGRDSI